MAEILETKKSVNDGQIPEEESSVNNAQSNDQLEQAITETTEKEDNAPPVIDEIDDRRNNIQQWMEKLAKIKREEFERDEVELIPLRQYLMSNVVPTLTKGLLEVTRARPFDPKEFLAEFLFQHNPESIYNQTEDEAALKNLHQIKIDTGEKGDPAHLGEAKELEERRNNIQQWMEKLAKIKREEFEREEASLIPLRHYLMAHVVPTLTKGLIEVSRARPYDPVEYLAEFLFQHNPGSINNATAHLYRSDMKK